MYREQDNVVQEPHGLLVGPADHLVHPLHELMRTEHLGGMQATVDPDDGLTLPRQAACFFFRHALCQREPPGYFLVPTEIRVIIRGGDDRHQLRAPLRGASNFLEHHPGRFLRQFRPICLQLRVRGEVIIIADIEAELFLGSRYALPANRRSHDRKRYEHTQERECRTEKNLHENHLAGCRDRDKGYHRLNALP